MAQLIEGLTVEAVRANVEQVRGEIADAAARAGRSADDVQLLAAVKYVAVDELPVLAAAGIELAGENRAQELVRKVAAPGGDQLTWDFIGHLQSRKVKQVLPLVRRMHSVSTDSVLRELRKHAAPDTEVLVEVNVAGDASKSGVAPAELDAFLERVPCRVAGLMTMPPLARDPEESRPWFAALARLASARGLRELSMGTSQDFRIAAQEGATTIRLGSTLFR